MGDPQSWVVEMRPKLRCANVFVIFKRELDTRPRVAASSDRLEIALGHETFEIKIGGGDDDAFAIVPNSVSGLYAKGRNLTFRCATTPTDGRLGTSKCELLLRPELERRDRETAFLRPHADYALSCSNCAGVVATRLKCDRVLPLPSESSRPDEWFCHAHSGTDTDFSLAPAETDIFYAPSFVRVNNKALDPTRMIVTASSTITCKRCLSNLGTVPDSSGSLDIWNHAVAFSDETGGTYTTRPLDDVFAALRGVLDRDCFVGSSHKFMIRHDCDRLCLWILESRLEVCVRTDRDGGAAERRTVAKVLFRFGPDGAWESDDSVSAVSVSKPMMAELLRHLYDMNALIPDDFAKSNGFYISYVKLYDRVS